MITSGPIFSIVVPTYNRPERLGGCLEAFTQLDFAKDQFEAIIVDDESPTALDDVVQSFRERLNVTLIRQKHAGPATARNRGASVARGRYLAFTDDDCTPTPSWLKCIEARFGEVSGPAIVGGYSRNVFPENPYSAASQALLEYLYDYFQSRQGQFFTSNNFAVPTEMFRALGGFEQSIPLAAAEDREFCVRWSARNLPLVYAPEAVVDHAQVRTLRQFWRQHFNYGRGAYYFRKMLEKRGIPATKIEAASFYGNLLRYPLTRSTSVWSLAVSALLFVSQLANASGFFVERASLTDAAFAGNGGNAR